MRKSDVRYLLSSVFVSVFSLSYCAAILFHIKLPRYYPLQHTWKMIKEEGVPSQGWYGMWAFGLLASAVITSLVYVVIRARGVEEGRLRPGIVKAIGAISIVLFLAGMVYTALHEFFKWGIL